MVSKTSAIGDYDLPIPTWDSVIIEAALSVTQRGNRRRRSYSSEQLATTILPHSLISNHLFSSLQRSNKSWNSSGDRIVASFQGTTSIEPFNTPKVGFGAILQTRG
jgi:hypothetical protein